MYTLKSAILIALAAPYSRDIGNTEDPLIPYAHYIELTNSSWKVYQATPTAHLGRASDAFLEVEAFAASRIGSQISETPVSFFRLLDRRSNTLPPDRDSQNQA